MKNNINKKKENQEIDQKKDQKKILLQIQF